jgi:hypothetical protein
MRLGTQLKTRLVLGRDGSRRVEYRQLRPTNDLHPRNHVVRAYLDDRVTSCG